MKLSIAPAAILLTLSSISSAASLSGLWEGTIRFDDYSVPFPIQFQQKGSFVSASFFNGDQRVSSTSGSRKGRSLVVRFDQYATKLEAAVENNVIQGTYGGKRFGTHDFQATPYRRTNAVPTKAPDIHGTWNIPFDSPKGEHAWRLIIRQSRTQTSAAILRVDGDTGALQGAYTGSKFVLNHFDGVRASTLEILPKPDGSLALSLKDPHGAAKSFTAIRLDEAKAKGLPEPADAAQHTRMKNPAEPFRFSFPDLSGKLVSDTDKQFKNKVVIIDVTGSWCPNCHDEAPFLEELYRKYHAQGLEIVALDFEEEEQKKDPARLQAFIKKYGIEYTYLVAGEPKELQEKVPRVENLNSWPTTFFLNREGRVRAVQAGFAAPASGRFHDELKREVTKTIEGLLADNVKPEH